MLFVALQFIQNNFINATQVSSRLYQKLGPLFHVTWHDSHRLLFVETKGSSLFRVGVIETKNPA